MQKVKILFALLIFLEIFTILLLLIKVQSAISLKNAAADYINIVEKSDNLILNYEYKKNFSIGPEHNEVITNNLGFRDIDRNIQNSQNGIFLVGDSTVVSMDAKYTINHYLEELVNQNVLNIGVEGYSLVQKIELVKEYLYLKPEVVVLVFVLNDLEEMHYNLLSDEQLKIRQNTIIDLYGYNCDRIKNPEGYADFEKAKYNDSCNRELTKKLFSTFKELSEQHDFIPVTVVLPYENSAFSKPFTQFATQTSKDAGILTIDMTYKLNKVHFHYKDQIHPNSKGNKVIADAIYSNLVQEKII